MANQSAVIWDESFTAAADLSSNQFYPVAYTAVDTVGLIANAETRAIGILQNTPKAGDVALVRMLGYAKAVFDGSSTNIGPGDLVGPNASGVLVKKTTADYNILGMAMDAVTAADIVGRVMLLPLNVVRTLAG